MKPTEKLSVRHMIVDQFMTPKVECVTFAMTVKDVIEMLLRKNFSGAPIVDQAQRLVSIISESDLMKFAATGGLNEPLQKYALKLAPLSKIVSVVHGAPFSEVFKKFLENPVRRVVVVDGNGKVLGIVSRGNVLRAFLESEAAEGAAKAKLDKDQKKTA
ncbi:MAG: CBS domain-containing protein [Bdellovibrionia bacterium]